MSTYHPDDQFLAVKKKAEDAFKNWLKNNRPYIAYSDEMKEAYVGGYIHGHFALSSDIYNALRQKNDT